MRTFAAKILSLSEFAARRPTYWVYALSGPSTGLLFFALLGPRIEWTIFWASIMPLLSILSTVLFCHESSRLAAHTLEEMPLKTPRVFTALLGSGVKVFLASTPLLALAAAIDTAITGRTIVQCLMDPRGATAILFYLNPILFLAAWMASLRRGRMATYRETIQAVTSRPLQILAVFIVGDVLCMAPDIVQPSIRSIFHGPLTPGVWNFLVAIQTLPLLAIQFLAPVCLSALASEVTP